MSASRAATVAEVVAALERCYPPSLAESWDAVGLVCGDPEASARRVLFAVDPVAAVVEEADRLGANLLVTHHPLLFAPVRSLSEGPPGRLVQRLVRSGIALFVAHTNADAARPGVSDALAAAVGLPTQALARLSPAPQAVQKLVTFVPGGHVQAVVDALAAAGAGSLGEYRRCAYLMEGTGTFEPGERARPAIGHPGQREVVAETRVEMVLPAHRRAEVVRALVATHPYEEPAFEVYDLAEPASPSGVGAGRVGDLAEPMRLAELAEAVARALPPTAGGVKVAGEATRLVRRVAVCGGSGGEFGAAAAASGADAFLTSDLRHHQVVDLVAQTGLAVLDAPHWATEWPWLAAAARRLDEALPDGVTVESTVSSLRTDPWTMSMPAAAGPLR
ncbi:MAG: Nif3-like dinuclear metal center hexameric protein [Mycobacteriales bacterium]